MSTHRMARLGAALLAALLACAAQAQYPSRAIRMLVPNPPGGATDLTARVIAPKLSEALGQPVVVENRAGSNGNIAAEMTARSAPDGYTLMLCADAQIVISPHLYSNLPFDVLKDITPVSTITLSQMVLAANPALPVRNFQEFIEYAKKANPPLAYASIGNGSQHHLAMEMLKGRAGIDLVHIPYKGGGPATIALLSGEVMVMFGGASVSGHIRAGKMRPLAVVGRKRSAALPEVPTIGEFYPGYEIITWLGVCGPGGMPEPVLSRLRAEFNKLLALPEVQERLRTGGNLEAFISSGEEFAAMVRSDYAKYGQVVKQTGAKVD